MPGLRCQENGQELSPIALESGSEPRRAKQEARNQKRAQGRGEVGSGTGPGAQAGPSAKRAVHLRRGPEGEVSRDGPGPQGDAPPFLSSDPATQVRVRCLFGYLEIGGGMWTKSGCHLLDPGLNLAPFFLFLCVCVCVIRLRLRSSSMYHH